MAGGAQEDVATSLAAANGVGIEAPVTVAGAIQVAGGDFVKAYSNGRAAQAYTDASNLKTQLELAPPDYQIKYWNQIGMPERSLLFSVNYKLQPGMQGYNSVNAAAQQTPGLASDIFRDIGGALGAAAQDSGAKSALHQVLHYSNAGAGVLGRVANAFLYTSTGGIPGGQSMFGGQGNIWSWHNVGLLRYFVDPDQYRRGYDAVGKRSTGFRPDVLRSVKANAGSEFNFHAAVALASGETPTAFMKSLDKTGPKDISLVGEDGNPVMVNQAQYKFQLLRQDPAFTTQIQELQGASIYGGTDDWGNFLVGELTGEYTGDAKSNLIDYSPLEGINREIGLIDGAVLNMFEGMATTPLNYTGYGIGFWLVARYGFQDGDDLLSLYNGSKGFQASTARLSSYLVDDNAGKAIRDLAGGPWSEKMIQLLVDAQKRTPEEIIEYMANGEGLKAFLGGQAGKVYKDVLLVPHENMLTNLALKAKMWTNDNITAATARAVMVDGKTPVEVLREAHGDDAIPPEPKDLGGHMGLQAGEQPAQPLQLLRRLANRLVRLVPEGLTIDINNPEQSIKTVQRLADMFLSQRRADELVAQFMYAANESQRRSVVIGLVQELVEASGMADTADQREIMRNWMKEFQQYSEDREAGEAALDTNQLAGRMSIPSFRDLYNASKTAKLYHSWFYKLAKDSIDTLTQVAWKPAMLFRLGFGYRVAAEETLGAIFRDGIMHYLMSLAASNTRRTILSPGFMEAMRAEDVDPELANAFLTMNSEIPASDFNKVLKYVYQHAGERDPDLVNHSGFGKAWRVWLGYLTHNRAVAWGRATGVSQLYKSGTMAELLQDSFRLANDPRTIGALSDQVSAFNDALRTRLGIYDASALGKEDRLAQAEWRFGRISEQPKPTARGLAVSRQEKMGFGSQLNYGYRGLSQGALGKVALKGLADGEDDDAITNKVMKAIDELPDKTRFERWDHTIDGTKIAHPGELLPPTIASVTHEDGLRQWASTLTKRVKYLVTDPDGELLAGKDGKSWAGRLAKGDVPTSPEIADADWDKLPQAVLAPAMVHTSANPVRSMIDLGMRRFVADPLNKIAREPMYLWQYHKAYRVARAYTYKLGLPDSMADIIAKSDDMGPLREWVPVDRLTQRANNDPLIQGAKSDEAYQLGLQKIDDIAHDIQQHGWRTGSGKAMDLGPITIQYNDATGKIEVVNGAHRFEAAKRLGMTHVPVQAIDLKSNPIRPSSLVDLREYDPIAPAKMMSGEAIAHDIAMQRADRAITPYIHNPELRSQFSIINRNIMPFYFAQEQQVKRWARTLTMNPAAIRQAELTMNLLKQVGFTYTDPDDGQAYFYYPGTSWISDMLNRAWSLVSHVPALNVNSNLTGAVSGFLPGLNNLGQPSWGPGVSVALDGVADIMPNMRPYTSAIVGSASANETWYAQLMPTIFSHVMDAFGSTGLANAEMEAIQYLTSVGRGMKENMTAGEKEKFNTEVTHYAQIFLITRALLGFAAPSAPEVNIDPLGLHADFETLLNQGLPYNQAVAEFLTQHPTGTPYVIPDTKTTSGAYVGETDSTMAYIEAHIGFFTSHPLAAPWLMPTRVASGVFSDNAYEYELSTQVGIRYRLPVFSNNPTVPTWEDQLLYKMASNEYYATEAAFAAAANAPNADYDAIWRAWYTWKNNYSNTHPNFTDQQGEGALLRTQVINDMANALIDPTVPETPQLDQVRYLMDGYAEWKAYMNATVDNPQLSQQRDAATQAILNALSTYAQGHPDVLSFWNSILSLQFNPDYPKG